MRRFAKLLSEIEQTNSTNEKVDRMVQFFKTTDPETSVWALYFLSGQRPRKLIGSGKLRSWAEELAGIPAWLAEDCYSAVGDTAEMISLIVAPHKVETNTDLLPLAKWMTDRIEPLRDADEETQRTTVQKWWTELSTRETFVVNKLMTGALRIGVSETLVYRALAEAFGIPRTTVAARLLGKWRPSREFFEYLTRPSIEDKDGDHQADRSEELLPYPFCLAAPLGGAVDELGNIQEWQLEWKWDGIRAQVVKKGERVELWSRGEERVTESFPDLVSFFSKIPQDFVLDGEILGGKSGEIGSFNELQKRLNRKAPSAAMQRDHPVAFLAYDYLREGTEPLTALPLAERRGRLELFSAPIRNEHFDVSPLVAASTWEEAGRLHAQSRIKKAEGLMVKRKDAPYATGRKRGIWFKWKVDPLTLDVVLTSAQPGTGRRASLYTDYTFSIWKEDQLVPIAKAYSGLSDSEIQELDSWIRQNTLGRFGPVRSLRPERVFEIGFEGIGVSTRHKAGFAVRFPRILRERTDKPAAEADRVETVQELLKTLEIDTPRKPSAPPAETESLQGKLL